MQIIKRDQKKKRFTIATMYCLSIVVLRSRLQVDRNQLFRNNNNNVYPIIAIVSLIFVNGASINAAGISSNAQMDNQTTGLSSGSLSNATTITTYSSSVYSIPSTSVQLNIFNANYTIAGTISSLNESKELITSTIINDFDKNPNIGYVVNNGSSSRSVNSQTHPASTLRQSKPQPGIPNPFVSTDMVNQKITNEIQHAIAAAAASSTNALEKHVDIRCTFGMILADYKCS
jgi:hypothetical protein